jgi:flagellar hook-associated protein 1
MPGLSSSINIGLSGLQANQSALNIVGHNIANVNTPGFSRQRVVLSSGLSQTFGTLQFGSGVNLSQIVGVRDRFLDMQITQALSKQSGANARYSGVEAISSTFNESGDSGLGMQIQKFFQGFQELTAAPEDNALRTNLLGQAQTMVTGLQSRYKSLEEMRTTADATISSVVQVVNTLTGQVAELNKRITAEPVPGSDNDARDQRKNILDQLAQQIGIQVYEDDRGQVQVALDSGAAVLVSGVGSFQLSAAPDPANGNHLGVKLGLSGGTPTDVTSQIKEGVLGANLDLRDNVLSGYQRKMDELAAGIVGGVNLLHRAGFGTTGAGNNDFFAGTVANGANGLPTTVSAASNYKGMVSALSINSALVADPKLIAAASVAGAPGNNTQARALADLYNASATVDTNGDGVGDSGPYSSMVAGLANLIGTDSQQFQIRGSSADNLATALQTQRDRVSGVDLDEEATNMITFQRGYQAASRFVNVINQLTDQLVNQFAR